MTLNEAIKVAEAAQQGNWRCSRPDMVSYRAHDGVQESFVYPPGSCFDQERAAFATNQPVEDARAAAMFLLDGLATLRALKMAREAMVNALETVENEWHWHELESGNPIPTVAGLRQALAAISALYPDEPTAPPRAGEKG